MQFLLSHWHCILPVLAIVVAMLFMNRGKTKTPDQHYGADSDNNDQEY